MKYKVHVPLFALLLLGACATIPSGPSVMVLPGTGKNFDQFRLDESECRRYSSAAVGGNTTSQAASDSGVKSAAVGTVIGAAAGAAIGGGQGAAVGAGVGLAGGALAGTAAADTSSYGVQRRYDIAFTQCMYAKGHRVPVSGNFVTSEPGMPAAAPAALVPAVIPPPPPGTPPPPPPR